MSDDFQVKQSVNTQSNSGAYGLTGAGIGALGGGFGSYFLTKPKYASHTDIINEAKDSADFKSKLEKADGEQKKFLQAAKDVADEKANAEKVWDEELKKYQETHKQGFKETDDYKKLVEAKNNAEKALKDKKAELEKAEIPAKEGVIPEKTQKSINKVKKMIEEEKKTINKYSKTLNAELKKAADNIYEAANNMTEIDNMINDMRRQKAALEATKRNGITAKSLTEEEIKKINEDIENLNKSIDESVKSRKVVKAEVDKATAEAEKELRKSVEAEMAFPKGKEGKKQVDAKVKEIKAYILDTVQERTLADSQTKVDIAKIAEDKENAIKNLKELTTSKKGYEGVNLVGKTAEEAEKEVGKHITVQKKQLEKIESFKELYRQAAEKAKASCGRTTTVEEFNMMIGSWETPLKIKRTTTVGGEEAKKFIDTLTKDELATFNRLVEGGDEEAINKAINARKDKIAKLESNLNTIKVSDAKVTELGGNGAYIKKGILYNAEGEKVTIKPKEVKIAEGVTVPKSSKLRKLEEELAKLESTSGKTPARKYTEAEIKEKLAAETKAYEEAKAAVEKAKTGLEKVELKAEEQIAEFAKSKGVKDKKEFVDNQVKEKTEKFAKDFENQFKRKWGFAEHTNWKIAGAAAAGAVVLGGLFSLFAPKKS